VIWTDADLIDWDDLPIPNYFVHRWMSTMYLMTVDRWFVVKVSQIAAQEQLPVANIVYRHHPMDMFS